MRGSAAAASASGATRSTGMVATACTSFTPPGPTTIVPSGPTEVPPLPSSSTTPPRPLVVRSVATTTETGSSRPELINSRRCFAPGPMPPSSKAAAGAPGGDRVRTVPRAHPTASAAPSALAAAMSAVKSNGAPATRRAKSSGRSRAGSIVRVAPYSKPIGINQPALQAAPNPIARAAARRARPESANPRLRRWSNGVSATAIAGATGPKPSMASTNTPLR
jgi:hypothetical protein